MPTDLFRSCVLTQHHHRHNAQRKRYIHGGDLFIEQGIGSEQR